MMYENYKEEVTDRLLKMSKALREKIRKITEIKNTEDIVTAKYKVKKITDTFTDKEIDTYDCWAYAINVIYRRRGTFHLAAAQLKLQHERIIGILKMVREYEEKVELLNNLATINQRIAKEVYGGLTKSEGICKIGVSDSGVYTLSVSDLKKAIKKEADEFNEHITDGRVLVDCLYQYAEQYNLTEFIGSDIEEAIAEIKQEYPINPELMEYYEKYSSRKGNIAKRVSSAFLLDEENDIPTQKEQGLLLGFDEAKPSEAYYNYGLFTL